MGNNFFRKSLLAVLALGVAACTTPPPSNEAPPVSRETATVAPIKNLLNYSVVYDLNDYKGSSFLTFMSKQVKPSLDQFATQGFQVGDARVIERALNNVDPGVAREAIKNAGSKDKLLKIADSISREGKVTFYDLPGLIAKNGGGAGRYGLATFLSLASGGGVALKIDNRNFAYNVNYGSGKQDKDEMTGRSFGEGPDHKANDASDKFYLQSLEKYVRTEPENIKYFYKSLLEILINTDPSNYHLISEAGQTVGGDFLAVYTAEQDRHMMANLRSHPWDEALLEVTLLAAFHSRQDKVNVMYNGVLTDKVPPQATGCSPKKNFKRDASLIDYWQFSNSSDPKSCSRSGINVTRRDFRALGRAISKYINMKNPSLVRKVEAHFNGVRVTGNVFADLSSYLINYKTPSRIPNGDALVEDMVAFLMETQKAANSITSHVQSSNDDESDGD